MTDSTLEAMAQDEVDGQRDVRLKPVDLTDLAEARASPVDYAVQGLIPKRHVTLIGGHGGMGKSMLGLTLAAHVVCGRDWADLPCAKAHALFVSLEDEGALVRLRLRNVANAYGFPMEWLEAGLHVLDGTAADAALAVEVGDGGTRVLSSTPTLAELRESVEAAEYGLVVIDNASDAYAGNENDRRQVRQFIRWLAQLARESDAALVLLAHIDKVAARKGSLGNSYSGSTAWHNSARSRLALVDEGGQPILRHEKSNHGKPVAPIRLQFNDRGVLMPITGAAARAAMNDDVHAVMAALRDALSRGMQVTTATSGPATAYHVLEPLLPESLRGATGKRKVHAALLAEEKEGRISREEYVTDSRNRRTRWAFPSMEAA